ncbi:MAG: alanine racemase, partial [Clostridiales bacterium]|nr:alanine racemase [Clostridiales bacterium]
ANAYGHGLNAIEAFSAADEFAVSSIREALDICERTDKPVNILSLPDKTVECRYDAGIYPSVATREDIEFAAARGARSVNIKLNSGMNRYGAEPTRLGELLRATERARLSVKSVFSHIYDTAEAVRQFSVFMESVHPYRDSIPQKHILSGNFVRLPSYMHLDMVRPGLVLYGYGHECVQPAIRAVCGITQVRRVCKGENIGYGQWKSEIDRTVAVLGAGYGDGVRRIAGNTPRYVEIGGRLCPIVGQICMDAMMADVSGLAVKAGDAAIVLGRLYGCEAVAVACDTIPYEICTAVSARVQRFYSDK